MIPKTEIIDSKGEDDTFEPSTPPKLAEKNSKGSTWSPRKGFLGLDSKG